MYTVTLYEKNGLWTCGMKIRGFQLGVSAEVDKKSSLHTTVKKVKDALLDCVIESIRLIEYKDIKTGEEYDDKLKNGDVFPEEKDWKMFEKLKDKIKKQIKIINDSKYLK